MPPLPPDVVDLLDEQEGVVSRQELLGLDLPAPRIDALVRRGALERVGYGVYRRTGSGSSPHQAGFIALRRCGEGARLSGARILGYLGIEGFAPTDPFVVLLPPGRRSRATDLVLRTDHAPDRHHATYGRIPGTTPTRALVELAAGSGLDGQPWSDLPDTELLKVYDRTRWRGAVTATKLAGVIDDVGRHPGARRLRELLATTAAVLESPGERGLERALDGFEPPLEWQIWVAPQLRVDGLWRDLSMVVEYDGEDTHGDQRDREADAQRHERLRALGYVE
jgi:hypothetical protein